MKTVMKKLLSLALVAILLVSAVPFQAAADETAVEVKVSVYVNDKFTATKSITVNPDAEVELTDELGMSLLDNKDNRKVEKWVDNQGNGGKLYYSWLKDHLNEYALSLYITDTTHVHDYKEVVTKKATCTEAGVITMTCACGATNGTKEIPMVEHDWSDWVLNTTNDKNTRTCQTCNTTETKDANAHVITFYVDENTSYTRYWSDNQRVTTADLPTPPVKELYDFIGWYTKAGGEGTQLETPFTWDKNKDMTFYAYYQENEAGDKDGVSKLTVRMKVYNGDSVINDEPLLKEPLKDGTKILSWLQANESDIADKVFAKVDSAKYEWVERVYYNNDASAELTSQDTIANGDKTVYIKVYLKDSQKTNVQLYIHKYNSTSKTYSTLKIVDVTGYKAGDTITLTQMASVVKKSYSYTAIKGLYTDTTWKQLIAGQNPTASTSLTVESGNTVKYHVILNGATAVSSSKADTTNPKTGDMIFVPMMVMMASAAAVAFVYMSSKKRAR